MKKITSFLLPILCVALGGATVQAATNYWDINGATAGAGGAVPAGTWDLVTANWTTDSTGASTGNLWTAGDDAVFAAGTDAAGTYAVTVDTAQTAGNLSVEEGTLTFTNGTSLNVGGGVAGKGTINVATGLTATISTALEGGDDTGQITKAGDGTLVLPVASSIAGKIVVAAGTLQFANASSLGSTLSPTIVSNGATLRTTSTTAVGEPVIIAGNGVGNVGALRCTGTTPPQANGWSGGITLSADSRINLEAGGTWTFTGKPIIGTNATSSFNLTIGGNGGSLRCNVATGGRTFLLGGGTITKVDGCELRFETANIAGALVWSGGHLLCRSTLGFLLTSNGVPSPITINAGAGQLRTGSAGPSWPMGNDVTLNAGANPVFNPDTTFYITNSGVLHGPGGITKSKGGTLILTTNNTYTGNTVITVGTLSLTGVGSISNSAVIDVQGGTLDVSGVTAGFELTSAQTLKGNGTINGNVTATGTISPGASTGTLTFNNALTVAGNLFIEVNKSSTPSNDVINVTGALTNAGTGTLTLTNTGFHLTSGDVFHVFNQPLLNGNALTVASSGGVQWTNKLAVDGTVEVLFAPDPVPATNLTVTATGLTSRSLAGLGAANSTYFVIASTNIDLPAGSWWILGSTTSDGAGLIQFVDPSATNSQQFYRFGQ